METILAILVGSILGPIVTALLKRLSFIDPQLGAAINLAATVFAYIGAWWLVTGGERTLLEQYLVWSFAAAGIGGAANNVWRKRLAPSDAG